MTSPNELRTTRIGPCATELIPGVERKNHIDLDQGVQVWECSTVDSSCWVEVTSVSALADALDLEIPTATDKILSAIAVLLDEEDGWWRTISEPESRLLKDGFGYQILNTRFFFNVTEAKRVGGDLLLVAAAYLQVHAGTSRRRSGADIRVVIADLNPILRGWGNYFRTGNAANKFRQIDWYVMGRLRSLMIKKRGRNLRAGQIQEWSEDWFNGHGLHRLRGHHPLPEGGVTMPRRSSVSRVCGKTARTD